MNIWFECYLTRLSTCEAGPGCSLRRRSLRLGLNLDASRFRAIAKAIPDPRS